MSLNVHPPLYAEEVDVLAGAINAWCAERRIEIESQDGLGVASKAIDLYHAGHHTHDQLLGGLHELDTRKPSKRIG